MGYHLNRLDESVFMAVSKPLLPEFGIHHRLESCDVCSWVVYTKQQIIKLRKFSLCRNPLFWQISSVRFFQVEDLCDIDSLHQRFGDGRFQLCRHGHERRGEIETTRRIFWTIFGLYGNGKSIHHNRI